MKREINMRPMPKNKIKGKGVSNPADMRNDGSIITDPNGSYTGVPIDCERGEMPIQDADDL